MIKFRIKKGKHYCSNWWFKLQFGKRSLRQVINFSKECWYKPLDEERDWNKGMGFTYSLFNDKNSIRWCWRPHTVEGVIEIGIYRHQNGMILKPTSIMYLPVEEDIVLNLFVHNHFETAELICFNDFTSGVVEEEFVYLKPKLGYVNRPYFGGTNPSPHNMTITIYN